MKKKRVFQKVREEVEESLRRLCGHIPLHARLYVVLTMLAVFAFLSNYLFFQGICHIFFEERGNEGNMPDIEHIETQRKEAASQRQYQPIKVLRLCTHSKERQPPTGVPRLN